MEDQVSFFEMNQEADFTNQLIDLEPLSDDSDAQHQHLNYFISDAAAADVSDQHLHKRVKSSWGPHASAKKQKLSFDDIDAPDIRAVKLERFDDVEDEACPDTFPLVWPFDSAFANPVATPAQFPPVYTPCGATSINRKTDIAFEPGEKIRHEERKVSVPATGPGLVQGSETKKNGKKPTARNARVKTEPGMPTRHLAAYSPYSWGLQNTPRPIHHQHQHQRAGILFNQPCSQSGMSSSDCQRSRADSTHNQQLAPTDASSPNSDEDDNTPRKHGVWSPDEDVGLHRAVQIYGLAHWKEIAKFVPGRTHIQCQQRWHKVLDPDIIKGKWTAAEDRLLREGVERWGTKKWAQIAKGLGGRNAKQCRERWTMSLDPSIDRTPWTLKEDALLSSLYEAFGTSWAKIKRSFPNRSCNQLKTRCQTLCRHKSQAQKN